MARIAYYAFPTGRVQGGMKMIIRHVETLRELGFDAVLATGSQSVMPTWLEHRVPVQRLMKIQPDDVLVLPEDAAQAIGQAAGRPQKSVIFCQNQFILALSLAALDRYAETRPLTFIAVGAGLAGVIGRAYPQAQVEVVPCFADERRFAPAGERGAGIAYVSKKRAFEPQVIQGFFRKFHPRHADRPWTEIKDMAEAEVAQVMGRSALYLSLSRFESVGMATLEAMASGCVCAGFTGIGGQEYATAENGFWVPEDDCEAAADALGRAADLVQAGGPELKRHLDAGYETARAWSYARFRAALEETWMRLAPEARLRDGPLD